MAAGPVRQLHGWGEEKAAGNSVLQYAVSCRYRHALLTAQCGEGVRDLSWAVFANQVANDLRVLEPEEGGVHDVPVE
jgi:hypothetical protein